MRNKDKDFLKLTSSFSHRIEQILTKKKLYTQGDLTDASIVGLYC